MSEPIVQVEEGKLRGKTRVDYKGGKFYSFQSIPYAKPPIGDLRFKVYLHYIIFTRNNLDVLPDLKLLKQL